MSDNNPMNTAPADIAQLNHAIGQLTGAVQAMHTGLTARIADIRADIHRMETAHANRMDRMESTFTQQVEAVEDRLVKRLDGLGSRVTALEAEDKKLIEKTAKLSAVGGGVGGALAAVAVELIKRY
jgi:t-SNARE complex subunit (syntaxin)